MTTQTIPLETTDASEASQELVTQIPNYGLTWIVYIGLTVMMVAIVWYAIRNWHFIVKWFFASTIFAGALTPAHPVEGVNSYSPLVLNAVVNLFDGYQAEFMSGIKTLGLVWAILFSVGIIMWFIIKKFTSKKNPKEKMDTEAVMATPIEPTVED